MIKEFCHSNPRRFNCLTSSVRQEGVCTLRKVLVFQPATFLWVKTPSCLTEDVRQLNLLGFEWQNSFFNGNQVILIKTHKITFLMVTSMIWNFLSFAPIFYIFPNILVVLGVWSYVVATKGQNHLHHRIPHVFPQILRGK